MQLKSLYRWRGNKIPAVLAALCGFCLVAPSKVQAECAHYVVSRSHQVADLSGLELLSLSGRTIPSNQPPALPSPARREPCFGGMCSGAPVLPLAPAPVEPVRLDQWLSLAAPPPILDPFFAVLGAEPPLRYPSEFVATIDHPPRAHFLNHLAG